MFYKNAVEACHSLLTHRLKQGMTVVDATVGNGYDSLHVLKILDRSGKLIGLDIDPLAIENTQRLLWENGYKDYAQLYCTDHQNLQQFVDVPVDCILFNFGYLPGNKQRYTTIGSSSCQAVHAGLNLLKQGGMMILVLYTGHIEGSIESQMLGELVKALDQKKYHVFQLTYPNQVNNPPYLVYIERR